MTTPILSKVCAKCSLDLPCSSFPRRGNRASAYCDACWASPAMRKQRMRAEWRNLRERVTDEQYKVMLDLQGRKCGICKGEYKRDARRALAIDHCHVTGKVRGLLCTRCNTALGGLGDDAPSLIRVLEYLACPPVERRRRHKKRLIFVSVVRYVNEQGRRVPKGTPGAVKVTQQTKRYYLRVGSCRIALGTADKAEALRRARKALRRPGQANKRTVGKLTHKVVTRWLDADGRRTSSATPGAVRVVKKTKTFYVRVNGKLTPLNTSDRKEAVRKRRVIIAGD